MSGRWVAIALVALGGFGLFSVFSGRESVRDYLEQRCGYEGIDRDDDGNRARRYDCPGKPGTFAKQLADEHKPADRRTTSAGYFLRYQRDMVGVTAGEQDDRSRVHLADERNGYGFFLPYVGGFWGSYSGRGETFRGGGPGGGK